MFLHVMHYDGCMDRLDKHVFGAGPLLKLPMLLVGRLYGATSEMYQPKTPKPETFINNANLELTAKHGSVHFTTFIYFLHFTARNAKVSFILLLLS